MKISCEIIKDLLPLYEDGVCSEESRKVIEEHLEKCEECRALSGVKLNISDEYAENAERDGKVIKKGLKKIRLKWALSLVAVLMMLPILLLSVNQIQGRGICFTNIDDITAAERFAKAAESGDYKKAADMMYCEKLYYDVQDVISWEKDEYTAEYRIIELSGKKWAVSEYMYKEYIEGHGERDIWEFLLLEVNAPVIPCDEFERIAAKNPDKIIMGEECTLNFKTYELISTEWGEYYVGEHSNVSEKSYAYDIFCGLYLADEKLYEEVKPMLLMQAEDSYNYNQKYYGKAKGMSLSEFEDFIRADYEEGLKRFEGNGFDLKNIRRSGCNYSELNKYWVTEFDVLLTMDGKTYEATLGVSVHDGKIKVEEVNVKTDNSYIENSFVNAFHLDYPGAV